MEEEIVFTNSKGNKLVGILSDAADSTEKKIVVMAHGFRSNKDSKSYQMLEPIFNKANISTFRFDFFGHGDSDGKFEEITISEAVDDILKAIAYVKVLGYTKIALVGSSFGGVASLMAASKSKDLYAMALKAPVSDFEELLRSENRAINLKEWKNQGWTYYFGTTATKPHKLNYAFFEDSKRNIAYPRAGKIKIPVLIVHGTKDEAVPLEQSKKTARLLKNGRLSIIEGADHRFTRPEHFRKMIKEIAEFIISQ